MTSAPGRKKKTAASTHRLIEEVPLWPAAAIQRGPRTGAMLNSSTSQKPMVLRNCDLESGAGRATMVMEIPAAAEDASSPNEDFRKDIGRGGAASSLEEN